MSVRYRCLECRFSPCPVFLAVVGHPWPPQPIPASCRAPAGAARNGREYAADPLRPGLRGAAAAPEYLRGRPAGTHATTSTVGNGLRTVTRGPRPIGGLVPPPPAFCRASLPGCGCAAAQSFTDRPRGLAPQAADQKKTPGRVPRPGAPTWRRGVATTQHTSLPRFLPARAPPRGSEPAFATTSVGTLQSAPGAGPP